MCKDIRKIMKSRKLGIVLSYVNTGLNMVIGLFMSAFLIRILGDTEYGLYKTMSSFANCLVLFEFGTGTVMARNVSMSLAKKEPKERIDRNISTVWSITNLLVAVILVVSIFFYLAMDKLYIQSLTPSQIQYGRKMFVFITVYLIASFYMQTLEGLILAYEYYPLISLFGIVKIVSRTLILICLLQKMEQAIWIAITDMFIGILLTLCMIVFCRYKLKAVMKSRYFDKMIFKQSLPLSLAIFLQVVVNQANSNVDNVLIGIKMSPEDVALYSVGLYVYSIFSSVTTIPISMYGPEIIRNVGNGMNKHELSESLIQPSRLIVLVGGSILFGFVSAGRQFIEIFYGKQYLTAWTIALLIMFPMFINMANGVAVNVLDAMNKRMARSKILIITTVLNIILTYIWIDWWGVIGATFATTLCTLLGQVIAMNLYYKKVIGLEIIYMFKETFRGILPFQILSSVVALIIGTLISNIKISLFVTMMIYIVVFGVCYLCFGMNKNEKELLNKILIGHIRR